MEAAYTFMANGRVVCDIAATGQTRCYAPLEEGARGFWLAVLAAVAKNGAPEPTPGPHVFTPPHGWLFSLRSGGNVVVAPHVWDSNPTFWGLVARHAPAGMQAERCD